MKDILVIWVKGVLKLVVILSAFMLVIIGMWYVGYLAVPLWMYIMPPRHATDAEFLASIRKDVIGIWFIGFITTIAGIGFTVGAYELGKRKLF